MGFLEPEKRGQYYCIPRKIIYIIFKKKKHHHNIWKNHVKHISFKCQLHGYFQVIQDAGLWQFFFFCLKTSSNIWMETQVLLNILRMNLGAAQIFHSHLWTVLLNFTAPLCFGFHAYTTAVLLWVTPLGITPILFFPKVFLAQGLGGSEYLLKVCTMEGMTLQLSK